jgi:heme-degrading monooxygenase HmoA
MQALKHSGALGAMLLSIATGMPSGGCGDEAKGTSKEPASRCAHDVLEPDLSGDAPIGPAVDRATGKLKLADGERYMVSSTYGVPKRASDGAPLTQQYLQLIGAVQEQLQREPGLLALWLLQSEQCGSGRTLAVWKSEEQMYDFVTSKAHLDAMSAADEVLQPGYAVTHWEATSADEMTMEEAIRQLAKVEATR